jgi:hypothetical protein
MCSGLVSPRWNQRSGDGLSKKRVSSAQRSTRRRVARGDGGSWSHEAPQWLSESGGRKGLKVHHFGGVALAGGKTDKTCFAILDFYPQQNKIFLSRLFEKIRTEGEVSADLQLHRLVSLTPGRLETLAFDVPLKLPKCLRCKLVCPGYEACDEPEIQWMWSHYRRLNRTRKPQRLFTPYTERCAELYLSTELEEKFALPHAMGSNLAPLTARAQFVARRLKLRTIEVVPRLSLWRMGRALHIGKSHLLFHKHAVTGEESRRVIVSKLIERDIAFIYDQDVRILIENNQAFEAFLVALTSVLAFKGQCEARPKDFPKSESFPAVPRLDLQW